VDLREVAPPVDGLRVEPEVDDVLAVEPVPQFLRRVVEVHRIGQGVDGVQIVEAL
jgi:hypothetical protein